MVQVIQPRDIGGEIGQAVGGGFSNIAQLRTKQGLAREGFDRLKALYESGDPVDEMDVVGAIAESSAISPGIADASESIIQQFRNKNKRLALEAHEKSRSEKEQADALIQEGDGGEKRPSVTGESGQNIREISELEQIELDADVTQEELDFIKAAHRGEEQNIPEAIAKLRAEKQKSSQASIARMNERRDLERAESSEILGRTQGLLQKSGLIGEGESVPEVWDRSAYNMSDQIRKNNPKLSNQQIWNQVGQRIERQVADLAKQAEGASRPTFRPNKAQHVEQNKRWVANHKRAYGDSKETRDILKDLYRNNSWSEEEVNNLVQPLNPGMKQSLGEIPQFKSYLAFGDDPKKTDIRGKPEVFNKVKGIMSDRIVSNWDPATSLIALKSELVRGRGLKDSEAIDVINTVQDKLGAKEIPILFTEEQIAQLPIIAENTRPSLIDFFTSPEGRERKVTELLGPLVR